MAKRANQMSPRSPIHKYPCPCCEYLTLDEPPPGTFNICPVCGWEDDNVQFNDPDFHGGANQESLRDAKRNFRILGAKNSESLNHARKPLPDELPQ